MDTELREYLVDVCRADAIRFANSRRRSDRQLTAVSKADGVRNVPVGHGTCNSGPAILRRCFRRPGRHAVAQPARPNLATASIFVGTSYVSLGLWYVALDVSVDTLNCFRQWLSDDELARAERLHSEVARARYIVGRAALRRGLSDRLGCSPAAIRFSYGKNGKPMLEGSQGRVEFNLAHSEGDAVIALSVGAAVGVDIEHLRPIGDVESLARLVFSDAERRELDLAPDPVLAFLNGWTRKEAYVKALGLGLAAPLQEISVSLSRRAALFSAGLPDQPASNWRLLSVPHPRAVVALALGPRPDSATAT